MSQHDFILADASGSAFLADLNLAVKALAENNYGTTEPTVMYAHMWWADTTNDILKKRNAANTGWISYLTLSTGAPLVTSGTWAGNATTATTATTAASLSTPMTYYEEVTSTPALLPFVIGVANRQYIVFNYAGTVTVTFPVASSWEGHVYVLKTITANAVISASSNVVPLTGGSAGTAILSATDGKWVEVISDGTNWLIVAGN